MSRYNDSTAVSGVADLARARTRLYAWVLLLFVSACSFGDSGGGCGDSLINNYRFDRWCGDELCNWTTLTGPESIRKAPTWHESDHGVELLATPTVLTQVRSISGIECLELSMVADVESSADVTIGIDYNFDGDPSDPADEADVSLDVAVDDEWTLPPARWKKLTFLSSTPERYSGVRFVIRKRGVGRAVLAEVRAQSSDQCTAPRPVADNLPLGVGCDERSQCLNADERYCTVSTSTRWNQAWCTLALPQWYCDGTGWRAHCAATTPDLGCETIAWRDWCLTMSEDPTICDEPEPDLPPFVPGEGPGSCSECATNDDCSAPNVCGLVVGVRGPYRSCVPLAALGERCSDDTHCTSQRCMPLYGYTFVSDFATCSECASDDDCADGLVCGLKPTVPARACVEPATKPLSTVCEADAECKSGICCGGRCSECCLEQSGSCTSSCVSMISSADGIRRTTPHVCQERVPQPPGEECLSNADCLSGACQGAEDVCSDQQHCIGSECQSEPDPDCTLITVAGTCQ